MKLSFLQKSEIPFQDNSIKKDEGRNYPSLNCIMEYIEVKIKVREEYLPEVEDCLVINGFNQYVVENPKEFSRMIESIDEYAFANCRMLEKVVFGEGIRRIAKNAFSRCARLKEVHFNLDYKSVKDLNSIRGCLNKCYNLESIFDK